MARAPLAALALTFLALAATGPALGAPPRPAPACELRALTSSEPPRLDPRLLGEVILVDFWASWCVPCVATFPILDALQRELGPRGLRVIGVGVDEEPAAARAFLAIHPAAFAVGLDAGGECQLVFGVEILPTSYLVDRQGRVRYVHRGYQPSDVPTLRRELEALLAEPPPAVAGAPDAPPAQPALGSAGTGSRER